MEKIFIFGAGGHAKVVIDLVEKQGLYKIALVFDDNLLGSEKSYCGYPLAGGRLELLRQAYSPVLTKGIIAIGENSARLDLSKLLIGNGFELLTAIHPSAQLGRGVSVGDGTVVMAGAVINPDVELGRAVVVNTAATVDHDCVISDGVHIAPGCHLCGNVKVGESTLIGAGTVVTPGVNIGNQVTIGAGSLVIQDIPNRAKVAGRPCRPIP